MDLDKIFNHNEKWVQEKLKLNPNYFNDLSKTHNPELLFIGCSDSRVPTEDLVGLESGKVFVHRNIANMVISVDLNIMSVVNYAIDHLKVDHIVVCGHYGCGGVKAAMEPKDLGILNPWLRNIRDVYRIHKDELDAIKNEEKKYERLVELNVEEQCINLVKTAAVQKANRSRNLMVHGWVFDIHTGKLKDLKIDFDSILKNIMEIYHLE